MKPVKPSKVNSIRKVSFMMSFIFILLFSAMTSAFIGEKKVSYAFFTMSVFLGLYWFNHHATDTLPILL